METRLPAAEITKGLQITSDKIRALARANYDRTEISKLLDIRYQHVRNVLLRSGIEGGLRRQVEVEREPVTVDTTRPPREVTSWEVLTDAGFQYLGEWTHDPESLIRLDSKAPNAAGVYAFVGESAVPNNRVRAFAFWEGWHGYDRKKYAAMLREAFQPFELSPPEPAPDPPSSVLPPGEDWASSPLFAALRLPRPGE